MKTRIVKNVTDLQSVEQFEGEPIEAKIRRITENNEPITDGAPIVYTEKADGVVAGYNVRTDRFEIAIDAMDKVNASKIARSKVAPESEDISNEVGQITPEQQN